MRGQEAARKNRVNAWEAKGLNEGGLALLARSLEEAKRLSERFFNPFLSIKESYDVLW